MVTYLCDTLVYVSTQRNVTLSLPDALLRRFRVYAAERNQSMTRLMAEAIEKLMSEEQGATAAKRRFLRRIQNAPDRGTRGKITWSRAELHER